MTAPRTIEFFFDYSCPYAYLGFTQVEAAAARVGAKLTLLPMLLGGVFRANDTPQKLFATLSPQKAKHNAEDMARWAEMFGVTLRMPAEHPFRTVEALRATIVTGVDPKVIRGFYDMYWVHNRPVSDEAVMREVLTSAGHDADAVLARIKGGDVKEELRKRTDKAIAYGIFGAPAYVVDGERMYWGQDRMHMALGVPADDVYGQAPRAGASERRDKMHSVEFFWDFSSPFAYLGSTQMAGLAARTGAKILSRPMLLGGLFKAIGQVDVPLSTWSPQKRYYYDDMHRWAAHWDVPFRFPTRFPMNTVKALRAYLALPEARRADFQKKVFAAYWAEDRDIADDAVLAELLGEGASDVLAKTQDPAVKQELIAATKYAEQKGVFGAPTFLVDDKELFWGQDRIVLVERALA
jgi:2-hydroxychromene-2-carboxylate isomerase